MKRMNETNQSQTLVPASAVVLIVTALGGVWLLRPPLDSPRPHVEERRARDSFGDQTVDARLWEDPLTAVERHRTSRSTGQDAMVLTEIMNHEVKSPSSVAADFRLGRNDIHSAEWLRQKIAVRAAQDGAIVLPVMVPGGDHAEDVETRRRDRYAVLAALSTKDYMPETAEHIGYLDTCWSRAQHLVSTGSSSCSDDQARFFVPYEWFERNASARSQVSQVHGILVLWIDEGMLGPDPIANLDELLRHLFPSESLREDDRVAEGKVKIKTIGPANSTTLRTLLTGSRPKSLETPVPGSDDSEPPMPSLAPTTRERWIRRLVDRLSPRMGSRPRDRRKEIEDIVEARVPPVQGWPATVKDLLPWMEQSNEWVRDMANDLAELWPASGESKTEKKPSEIIKSWRNELTLALLSQSRMAFQDGPKPFVVYASVSGDSSIPDLVGKAREIAACSLPTPFNVQKFFETRDCIGKKLDASRALLAWTRFVLPRLYPQSSLTQAQRLIDIVEGQLVFKLPKDIHVHLPHIEAPIQSSRREDGSYSAEKRQETEDSLVLKLKKVMDNRGAGAEARLRVAVTTWSHTIDWIDDRQLFAYPRSTVRPYIEFLSSHATIPWKPLAEQIVLGDPVRTCANSEIDAIACAVSTKVTGRSKGGFLSTVTTDDQVAGMMIDELERRRVDLLDGREKLAVIGEWDTLYARVFPVTVRDELEKRCNLLEGERRVQCLTAAKDAVRKYSYLRGLDGAVPGRGPEKTTQLPAANAEARSSRNVRQDEYPVGRNQFDSMRRLAEGIHRWQAELEARDEELGAIAVVGTDVYDKQLVLQAVHSRFPGALLVTTDLDARLLHPSQYHWSRNLIVVSSYGLELHDTLQQGVPPFRDSYQTATYLAALLATGPIRAQEGIVDEKTLRLSPRVFEVARDGAYDITPVSEDEGEPALHPPRRDPWSEPWVSIESLSLVVILMILCALLAPGWWRFLTGDVTSISRGAVKWLVFLTLSLSLLVLAAIFLGGGRGGEPFQWFNGISIWPTVMMRVAIVVASLYFVLKMRFRLKEEEEKLNDDLALVVDGESALERWRLTHRAARRFYLRPRQGRSQAVAGGALDRVRIFWLALSRYLARVSIYAWEVKNRRAEKERAVRGLRPAPGLFVWRRYQSKGLLSHRMLRVVPVSVLYVVFGYGFICLTGPPRVPVRGDVAWYVEWISCLLAFGAAIFLVFFVVDATRLCEQFVRDLAMRKTHWPLESRRALAQTLGIPEYSKGDVDDDMDVEIIARLTEVVGRLIFAPFFVLFIVLLSRNSYFDRWTWTWSFVAVHAFVLVYAVRYAARLRSQAERARREAVDRLKRLENEYGSQGESEDRRRLERIQYLVERIQNVRRGAFVPWSQHPVVRVLVIPFGGVGFMVLLELLAKAG